MALTTNVFELGVADVDLFECPVTLEGAVHTLHFHNKHTSAIALTVKFYDHSEGTTSNIIVKNIAAGEEYIFLKTLDVNAGDKIIAASDFTASVMATISAYTDAATPATTGFTPRGAWSSIVNYVANDLADRLGTSYICINPNLNDPPPSANWMINAEQGPEGTGDFMKDGSVAMTGNLDVGGNDITNVGLVAGRDVGSDGTKLDEIYRVNKYNATTAPSVNDDGADTSGNGAFGVGSRWYDLTGGESYTCLDPATGAAVWAIGTLTLDQLGALAVKNTAAYSDVDAAAIASVAEFKSGAANKLLSNAGVRDSGEFFALSDAVTITQDMNDFINAGVTIAGNRTLGNPANGKEGWGGVIEFTQDATGNRTITLDTNIKLIGADTFDLDGTLNSTSVCAYLMKTDTEMWIWPPALKGA